MRGRTALALFGMVHISQTKYINFFPILFLQIMPFFPKDRG